MNRKQMTIVAAVFIALTIIMGGLFVYEYSTNTHESQNYNTLNASYVKQQSSVVLNDAYAHWDYIAIENASLLEPQYLNNATLHWIGGPLSGTHAGIQNINATWNKFFGLWSSVWYYTVSPPAVSVSGNLALVTSQNQFVLTPVANTTQVQYLNVSYVLHYVGVNGNWSITNETWHIVGAGFVSQSQQSALSNYAGNLAFSHWNNIAIENNTTVMQQYASNATLNWMGGPLNGTYSGTSEINATWNRFFGLWSAVWFYAESPPSVTVGGNVANVSANVQFVVQSSTNASQFKYINVTYNILYYNMGFSMAKGLPNYMIYSEIFKITGAGSLSSL